MFCNKLLQVLVRHHKMSLLWLAEIWDIEIVLKAELQEQPMSKFAVLNYLNPSLVGMVNIRIHKVATNCTSLDFIRSQLLQQSALKRNFVHRSILRLRFVILNNAVVDRFDLLFLLRSKENVGLRELFNVRRVKLLNSAVDVNRLGVSSAIKIIQFRWLWNSRKNFNQNQLKNFLVVI